MAHRGDFGGMHEVLRKLGGMPSKPCTGTTITAEQLRNQFPAVSQERYEKPLEELAGARSLIRDRSTEEELRKASLWLQRALSFEEVLETMNEMKDSAPRKDEVRMRYIKAATSDIHINVLEIIQTMFETRANNWPESLKIGGIVPPHKTGDRNDYNNYGGVCLLGMASRILTPVGPKRLRTLTEQCRILDDIQSGFPPSRSTADATQITNESRKTLKISEAGRKQIIFRIKIPSRRRQKISI